MLQFIFSDLSAAHTAFAIGIALLAGFVKGATGFALPMIMVSGLASVLPPETAIAAMIVPTILSNLWQSLRGGGISQALELSGRFKIYIATLLVFIVLSAQLVAALPQNVLLLSLGLPIIAMALLLLRGRTIYIDPSKRGGYDFGVAAVSGIIGGLSGIWGPLTITYLTAINTPKKEQIRLTGVIFGMGAVTLALAHLGSGVLNAQSLRLSVFMVVPVLAGQTLGNVVQDRLDQQRFRRVTLFVLVVAGLNLVRRGLM
ncbi:sulfite exporter TauE/SafE family protein [Celeribacter sp.]|uniref:sulfite exporter TauE/SafE family protein n=1 Tax=Celeribacter sp. TaxID=1890673 RepID=UPI003A8C9AF4